MKITNYEKQKHNEEKLNVFVDGEYKFAISINGWTKNLLYVDKEITEKEIEDILEKDKKELALNKAFKIVSNGLKTRKEVEKKLKEKGFEENDINYAIDKIIGYGYINDEYYVKCYILERAIPNKWGENKILSNLLQKGIDKEIILNGISNYLEDDIEYKNAYAFGIKKYNNVNKTKYSAIQIKQKIVSSLIAKGYNYEIANRVLNDILKNNDE